MQVEDIADRVRAELRRRGATPFRVAVDEGLPGNAIRHFLDGHEPKAGRLVEICVALGWELYAGPPRDGPVWGSLALAAGLPELIAERLSWAAGEFEWWHRIDREAFVARLTHAMSAPPDGLAVAKGLSTPAWRTPVSNPATDRRAAEVLAAMADSFEQLNERGREDLLVRFWSAFPDLKARSADDLGPTSVEKRQAIAQPPGITEPDALSVVAVNEDDLPPGARSMAAREIEVAAGGGAVSLDDAPEKGRIWFRRDWLDRHGIDTTQCVVIGVRGESMEPTLPDGCSILVDRSRTRRRADGIFVIDADDGLIVKRLGKDGRRWLLVSDHSSWENAPWPPQATVIGEVRWASRTFK